MVDDILICRTTFDERRRTVGRQQIVPQMHQFHWQLKFGQITTCKRNIFLEIEK
jgi:hypothetical protein